MESVINEIKNGIPREIPTRAAQSALLTAGLRLFAVSSTPKIALIGGCVAATATIVEAIARPVLASILPRDSYVRTAIQFALTVACGTHLAKELVNYRISSLAFTILCSIYQNMKNPCVSERTAMLFVM